jgi:hypothetical protein
MIGQTREMERDMTVCSKWMVPASLAVVVVAAGSGLGQAFADDGGAALSKRYYGSVEGLYWLGSSVSAGNNGAVTSANISAANPSNSGYTYVSYETAANFQPKGNGLRAIAGTRLSDSRLDVFGRYIGADLSGEKSGTSTINQASSSIFASSVSSAKATTVGADKKQFHVFDVNAGLNLLSSGSLAARIFGGVQYIDLERHSRNQVTAPSGSTIPVVTYRTTDLEDHEKGWGFGARIGADATLALGSGLSLRVIGALSLLSVDKTTTVKSVDYDLPNRASVYTFSQTSGSKELSPLIELGANLDYTIPLGTNRDIIVTVGYTALDLQNRGVTITGSGGSVVTGSSSATMMQGVSAGVGLRW